MMKKRFFILTVLAAFLQTLYGAYGWADHRCCSASNTTGIQSVLPVSSQSAMDWMACCTSSQIQPVVSQASSPALPVLPLLGVFSERTPLYFDETQGPAVRQGLAYVPNQSNRYLELRVLLN